MEFIDDLDEKSFRMFAKEKNFDFFQTPEFAKLKEQLGVKHFLVGVKEGKDLQMAGVLLYFENKKIKNLYCPRGPVGDYSNSVILDYFLNGVTRLAKKLKADVVDIEPKSIVRKLNGKFEVLEEDESVIPLFEKCGYKHRGFSGQIPNFQLRFSVLFNFTKPYEQFRKLFASDKKKIINRNEKYFKIEIVEEDINDAADILKFRNQLSEKKHFHVEDKEYFVNCYYLFNQNYKAKYLRAIINFDKTMETIDKELKTFEELIDGDKNANKDLEAQRNSLRQKQDELKKFREEANADNVYCVGAGVAIYVNGNITYLFEHTDKKIGNLGVPTLLTDYLIRDGAENGYESLDLLGIINPKYSNNPNISVNMFKTTFGGDIIEYVGVFSRPISKLYGFKRAFKKIYYRIKGRIYEE